MLEQYPDVLTVRQVMEILQLGMSSIGSWMKERGKSPLSGWENVFGSAGQDLIDYCTPNKTVEKAGFFAYKNEETIESKGVLICTEKSRAYESAGRSG